MELPNTQFVNLIKELLTSDDGRLALSNHGYLPATSPVPAKLQPHFNIEEVIAVLKLVCEGASVACPIIQNLP